MFNTRAIVGLLKRSDQTVRFAEAQDRPQRARILGNNIRTIRNYLQHFGSRSFTVRAIPSLKFSHKNVVVGARPEICATENDRLKLIQLDTRRKPANWQELRVILDERWEAV